MAGWRSPTTLYVMRSFPTRVLVEKSGRIVMSYRCTSHQVLSGVRLPRRVSAWVGTAGGDCAGQHNGAARLQAKSIAAGLKAGNNFLMEVNYPRGTVRPSPLLTFFGQKLPLVAGPAETTPHQASFRWSESINMTAPTSAEMAIKSWLFTESRLYMYSSWAMIRQKEKRSRTNFRIAFLVCANRIPKTEMREKNTPTSVVIADGFSWIGYDTAVKIRVGPPFCNRKTGR